MKCPNCSLENPPEAIQCDCGYNFKTKKYPPKKTGPGGFFGGGTQAKEAYERNFRKWEAELDGPLPRKVGIKSGVAVFLLPLFLLSWLLLYGVSYFLVTQLLNWNEGLAAPVSLGLLCILALIAVSVGSSEKKAVQNWKKVVGKIEKIEAGRYGRSSLVSYECEGYSCTTWIGDSGGLSNSGVGDPVVLLVDPEQPKSCISYGGSSYQVR